MIKPIKSQPIFWKVLLLISQIIGMFASDRRSSSRYLPYQAQDLYKKGLINAAEYSKALKSDPL